MEALWLQNGAVSFRENVVVPDPKVDEALIRVSLAGICGTDLELVKGYYNFNGIPGHEFVGEVVKADSRPGLIGSRVVGEINCTCSTCRFCRKGQSSHCLSRTVVGVKGRQGCFARYLVLPAANLHPVPDEISNEEAVFVEPLAAALRIQEQLHIKPSERVLIVGSGRLGQLIARTLVSTGCEIAAVFRHRQQAELLAEVGVSPVTEKEVEWGRADVVIEASGTAGGFSLAVKAVRPGGTIVAKTTASDSWQLNLSSLVVDEVRIVGSRCGPFPPALRLLAAKLLDPGPLIEARYPLNEGGRAFQRASRAGALKVLLEID